MEITKLRIGKKARAKMKYSENYYSIGDDVWQGELYTPKNSKDLKILLNPDFHKDLIKSLV